MKDKKVYDISGVALTVFDLINITPKGFYGTVKSIYSLTGSSTKMFIPSVGRGFVKKSLKLKPSKATTSKEEAVKMLEDGIENATREVCDLISGFINDIRDAEDDLNIELNYRLLEGLENVIEEARYEK